MNRKLCLTFAVASVFLLLTVPTYADTVVEGHAESHTSVTTNIQGSGEVHTHIESTVNGKTKVLDSNKPGTYTLDNSSDTTTKPTISQTPSPTASPAARMKEPEEHNETHMIGEVTHSIRSFFHEVIQKILSAFHL